MDEYLVENFARVKSFFQKRTSTPSIHTTDWLPACALLGVTVASVC